jgi:hypothetical protein
MVWALLYGFCLTWLVMKAEGSWLRVNGSWLKVKGERKVNGFWLKAYDSALGDLFGWLFVWGRLLLQLLKKPPHLSVEP